MRWRLWLAGAVALVVCVLTVDWMIARARVDNVEIEISVDPPVVLADGQHGTSVTVRVSENGRPRARDLLQAWLGKGSGRVVPNWVYTDEQGTAVIEVTPNRYTKYAPEDHITLNILDTSIGRLVEVGKFAVAVIPVQNPE